MMTNPSKGAQIDSRTAIAVEEEKTRRPSTDEALVVTSHGGQHSSIRFRARRRFRGQNRISSCFNLWNKSRLPPRSTCFLGFPFRSFRFVSIWILKNKTRQNKTSLWGLPVSSLISAHHIEFYPVDLELFGWYYFVFPSFLSSQEKFRHPRKG